MRVGNDAPLGVVVRMARIRNDFRLQLLDDGRMIVDEHGMSGVVDEASEFARHGIAGKQDTRLQRLDLKPALALVFIGLAGRLAPKQRTQPALQPAPQPEMMIERDQLAPSRPRRRLVWLKFH
jgi:hypothetical protein